MPLRRSDFVDCATLISEGGGGRCILGWLFSVYMSYLLLSSSSFLCLVEAAASELIEEAKSGLYRVRLKSRPSFGNTYLDLNLKRWVRITLAAFY